jgi:hypothetical protein
MMDRFARGVALTFLGRPLCQLRWDLIPARPGPEPDVSERPPFLAPLRLPKPHLETSSLPNGRAATVCVRGAGYFPPERTVSIVHAGQMARDAAGGTYLLGVDLVILDERPRLPIFSD